MMFRNRLKILIFAVFLIQSPSFASAPEANTTKPNDGAGVPFEYRLGHAYIKLKLNDSDEYVRFAFDTGASATIVDSSWAESIGLGSEGTVNVHGGGSNQNYSMVEDQKITLEDGTARDGLKLVLVDLSTLKEASGWDFKGVIGLDLLKSSVTEMNYDERRLVFDTSIDSLNVEGHSRLPFEMGTFPVPQLKVGIELNNGYRLDGRVFLDSGAALSLMVNTPMVEKHQLLDKIGPTVTRTSRGVANPLPNHIGAAKTLTLGEYQFSDLAIHLSSVKQGFSSFKGFLGLLGSSIISRFNWVLDYRDQQLYFQPNRAFDDPHKFPLTGIGLIKSNQQIMVTEVAPSTPAEAAGLQSGDRIISINGYDGPDLEIYRKELERKGEIVQLIARKPDGRILKIELELQRLL